MVGLAPVSSETSLGSQNFSSELRELLSQGIPGTFEKAAHFLRGLCEHADRLNGDAVTGSRFAQPALFSLPALQNSIEELRTTLLASIAELKNPLNSFGEQTGMADLGSSLDTLSATVRDAGKSRLPSTNGSSNGSAADHSHLKVTIDTAVETFTRFLDRTQAMQNGSGLSLRAYYEGSGTQEERRELRGLLNQTTNALREVLTASKS